MKKLFSFYVLLMLASNFVLTAQNLDTDTSPPASNNLQNGAMNLDIEGNGTISGCLGLGTTNPGTRLAIYNGEISFTHSFSVSSGDKISLFGNQINQPYMVGFGFETSTFVDGAGNISELSDLYHKAEGSHRWYTNTNADDGLSATMALDRKGDLGLGTYTPDSRFQIVDGVDASLTAHGYMILGETSSANMVLDDNEIQARRSGVAAQLNLQLAGGNLSLVGGGGNLAVDGSSLYVNGSTNMVGIGTAGPEVKLHILGGNDVNLASGGYLQLGSSGSLNIAVDNNEIQARSDGAVSPLYLQNLGGEVSIGAAAGDIKAKLSVKDDGWQYYSTNENDATGWYFGASSDSWAIGGGRFVFDDDSGSGDPILMLDAATDGVAISASTVPVGYKLAVDGKVICEEVRVELSGLWPDYVFEENYALPTIPELESFIEKEGHLPGIPSAEVVADEGIALGEMQKNMMEKIEELSLYIIQLNKENEALKARMELVEKK